MYSERSPGCNCLVFRNRWSWRVNIESECLFYYSDYTINEFWIFWWLLLVWNHLYDEHVFCLSAIRNSRHMTQVSRDIYEWVLLHRGSRRLTQMLVVRKREIRQKGNYNSNSIEKFIINKSEKFVKKIF